MGFFSGKWSENVVTNPLGGTAYTIKKFNQPGTEGMSDAERRALAERQAAEDERRKRMLDAQRRRSRQALGVEGGQRSLMFAGSYGGIGGSAVAGG